MSLNRREYRHALRVARKVGNLDGRNASTQEVYRWRTEGYTDERLREWFTSMPTSFLPELDMSGQFAGVPSAMDIYVAILRSCDIDFTLKNVDDCDSIIDAYEDAWNHAALTTMERMLK